MFADCAKEARSHGYKQLELDAQLALGELELKLGDSPKGRASLESLERSASAKGFVLIARKAAGAVGENHPPPQTFQHAARPFQNPSR